MKIFVVVAPQDYQSVEIIGAYTKLKMAERARENAAQNGRRLGTIIAIHEVSLEG